MKRSSHYLALASVSLLLVSYETSFAQRASNVFPQQTQQGGLGGTAQGSFGTTGQTTLGQTQLGQTQLGQTQLGQTQLSTQQSGGQGANVAQQRPGGRDGFVGTDAEQVRAMRNARSPRQQRRALFDFAIDSLNEMRESRRRERARRNRPAPVRVQLRPLFEVQLPSSSELTEQAKSQLSRALPARSASTQISVSGSTATIQGSVTSDYDRKLAAKMLSLQPGISRVENQLTVEPGQ